jgi:L-fucose isomerase-like protein
MKKTTFGVIVGNRGFFPDALARDGRTGLLGVLKAKGISAVTLSPEETKYGSVETYADALKCAALFARNAGEIDGLIVTLPNFGDEKGVAESIKRSGLKVPVLVQAEPDDKVRMTAAHRRDSFCGKLSVCNNLKQAGIPYTLTRSHVVKVKSPEFDHDLDDFAAVCRVVKGMRKHVRFGAVGARTGAFNTVRYSEKILEAAGVAIETIDLSEVLGRIRGLGDADPSVKKKLAVLKRYVDTAEIPEEALVKMAKFGHVLDRWVESMELDGTAVQCWTSLQEYFGIIPCALMSLMSEMGLPSSCEVDVTGLLGMYILQLASGTPSAILDWNNNYGDDPDKCVLFHCSNLPKSYFEGPKMEYNAILSGTVGKDKSYGAVTGRIKPNPATFLRVSTDDTKGALRSYLGEGRFVRADIKTFGGFGVMEIPRLQALMQYVAREGFEHHVAVSLDHTARAVHEALTNYMGWGVHLHI